MPESALVVLVPEAEELVRAIRERFDASVRLGVPAHVTVLAPFMPPAQIGPEVLATLQGVLGPFTSFDFSLARLGRFPATTYLAPEPAQPFVALTEAVARRFPEFPPFRGEHADIVPHLTIASGGTAEAESAAQDLQSKLRLHGPIRARCGSIALLENASGMWRGMHVFALRPSGSTPDATPPQTQYS